MLTPLKRSLEFNLYCKKILVLSTAVARRIGGKGAEKNLIEKTWPTDRQLEKSHERQETEKK